MTASRVGSLYYLDCRSSSQQSNTAKVEDKENLQHQRYGHLGTKGLQLLAREKASTMITRRRLTSVSLVLTGSTTEVNSQPVEEEGQINYWAWYTVMSVER